MDNTLLQDKRSIMMNASSYSQPSQQRPEVLRPTCSPQPQQQQQQQQHLLYEAAFLEQAAHQNADGVVSLQRGDCGKAFHSFVATLGTLHKFRQYELVHGREPPLHCNPVVATAAVTPDGSSSNQQNCRAIEIPYLEDNAFFIYNHAIVFSRKPSLFAGATTSTSIESASANTAVPVQHRQEQLRKHYQLLDTITFCEAAAQFNLGLAYHQRGKHCGEDRVLVGALQLYEQSLATLRSLRSRATTTAGQTPVQQIIMPAEARVLQLAVMNNRIHILNELARYSTAQGLVNDLLLQSVHALSDDTALAFLSRADIDNFLLNALVIRRFNTAPSA